jgi:hypothetical protein
MDENSFNGPPVVARYKGMKAESDGKLWCASEFNLHSEPLNSQSLLKARDRGSNFRTLVHPESNSRLHGILTRRYKTRCNIE